MKIEDFFKDNKRYGIAFSGGVDSTYLLHEALKAGADVRAYYVKSAFQPEFERADAARIASELGAELHEINLDVLADETVASNPEYRCYYCKLNIMGSILEAARKDGCDVLCEGTNADDDISDRPGFRALQGLGVRSPLRDCGITKGDIRKALKDAGIDIWDKPAYACLATRIKTGEPISKEKLAITERAEGLLFDMGFTDFRVRMRGSSALIQLKKGQREEALKRFDEIKEAIGDMYEEVRIDEQER